MSIATRDMFIMDGHIASKITNEYVSETLPNAGLDVLFRTVGPSGSSFSESISEVKNLQSKINSWPELEQAEEIEDLKQGNGVKVSFSLSDSSPIERDLDNINIFRKLGVRMVQLTYNSRNLCGDGCTERTDAGLSEFGIEVIRRLEKCNMCLDLSHAGNKTSREAIEHSEQPVIFSHSNPKAVYDHPRNMSDELILSAVDTGGTIGINAYPEFVEDDPTIEDLIDHVDYLDELVGIENVALGLDFIDNWRGMPSYLIDNPEYADEVVAFPKGIESAGEIPNIISELDERGYSNTEIEGVMGENLYQVLKEIW